MELQARRIPDAPAILAPGRSPLTYGALHRHLLETEQALRAMGIGRYDRVAIVLPNGPELAAAVLTVAAAATCAPINPAYSADELDKYLADLQPHALITQSGIESPVRRVALARGIRVIGLSVLPEMAAGLFMLSGERGNAPADKSVTPDHVAVLLPTSGTTARPKIVPQTQAMICASAFGTVSALALRESDRCLNVQPLFHGHGLHATMIASLAAGASIVCTAGFDAGNFGNWLGEFAPTWYSAVPTIYQAILNFARRNREQVAASRFRFIRTSSAPLAPRFFAELERTFHAPVIDYYGMTEVASSPIACNPLPPRARKPGSVGVPVTLDVGIMDDGGKLLTDGKTGQVVVRGKGVLSGYEDNTAATAAAFAGDWFKTGDVGFFDGDGYLFLVGRSREIINRGGEKIAPPEVDAVLFEHPAVAEAATFAVPHPTLGEDVAAAVVLRPHASASAQEIRQFAGARLAHFKIPRQIVFVKEIPKGPTGKVKRVDLAAKLGVANSAKAPAEFVAPRNPLENLLAALWQELLELDRIGIHDDFFVLGGDSLKATHLLLIINEKLNVEVEALRFFEGPTIAEVAHQIEGLKNADLTRRLSSIIPRIAREGWEAVSIAQQRLCELQHALPDVPFLNILHALRLLSPLHVAILERSINEIVRRHEILRTTFAIDSDRYVQIIAPELSVSLKLQDLRGLPKSSRKTAGERLIREEALHSFDLRRGPLVRFRLLRLAAQEHLLLINMHQVVCDGGSLGVLVEELAALYDAFSTGGATPLVPLSIQYADFARWQWQWRSYPEIVAQLAYWREQLSGPLPAIELDQSRPIPTIDRLRTSRQEVALPARLSEAIKRFGREEGGSTLFMALTAAFKTLLHLYVAEEDVRVATLVANRNRPGTEQLIGPLANMIILRTNLGGDPSPREVMRRVRATALAAFARQELPFEELAETLEKERGLEPEALSKVMFLLQNAALSHIAGCERKLAFEDANPGMLLPLVTITKFDVILMLRESDNGLIGCCVYKTHMFRAGMINRLLRDFRKVIQQMLTAPERPISTMRISRIVRGL